MTKYLCVYLQYGWYWGPISRVASERLLSNEPDGSFIVRDSSADHYIFSLTFKLDNKCSHVRIENHHGKSRYFAIYLSQGLIAKMLKGDTDTDTLISEISTDTYTDTFQVQNFDTDTIPIRYFWTKVS